VKIAALAAVAVLTLPGLSKTHEKLPIKSRFMSQYGVDCDGASTAKNGDISRAEAAKMSETRHRKSWQNREQAFAAFTTGPLTDFWRQREECELTGVDGVVLRFVRFVSPQHQRVILISPGRIETYVKYAELAWDLFYCGYDVLIIDHRGQGRSGRMLSDTHRGHVVRFSDYVDDLELLWQREIAAGKWRKRYALAHSMGGAITTLFLQRNPQAFDAIALCAPMFGIVLHLPEWMVRHILDWAEGRPRVRENYAIGTGRWRALPFSLNVLTHSRERYRRNLRYYADEPGLRVGGPTYHWVREGILAGEQVIAHAQQTITPMLLIQAEDDRVVDNRMHDRFCSLRTAAGHPCDGGKPLVIRGAFHEVLFEKDKMRARALNAIVDFFDRYN
jgi:lysophospholipase